MPTYSHPAIPAWNEPFLWGVATSGYQSEGGYNTSGQPQNNWALHEQEGLIASTGDASGFWTRYEEDFRACQAMGLNSFRLGLEWARIQPSSDPRSTQVPEFDYAALDAYADRIAACYRYGLEPIVTLHHFTHPAWLGLDAWLSESTVELFENYVRVSMTHINRRLVDRYQLPPIRWIMTINELNILGPNTYLSGLFPGHDQGTTALLQAYNILLKSHVRAYNCLHSLYQSEGWLKPLVSLNTCCSDLYWSDKALWDLLAVKPRGIERSEVRDYLYHNARQLELELEKARIPLHHDLTTQFGKLGRIFANFYGSRIINPQPLGGFLQELENSPYPSVIDYVALDYYDPFFVNNVRLPLWSQFNFKAKGWIAGLTGGFMLKCWDWRMVPEGLYFYCQYYAQDLQLPVMIAENGMALRREPDNQIATCRPDGVTRSEFLERHLHQVRRLLADKVPLIGYMHWSLTDNYEWGSFTPRFGLFAIDYTNGTERLVTDHLGDRPSETYARLIREFAEQPPG